MERSKACKGWPRSIKTKLVISTTLLMDRMPEAVRRCCTQSGEGPICTPRTIRAT